MPPLVHPSVEADLRAAVVFIVAFSIALLIIVAIYYTLFPIAPTPGL
jgi:hypothetical protein